MARSVVTAALDQARFDRAVRAFLSRQAPKAVGRAARRIAVGVVQRTVQAITSGEVPRVDTGRYRAAWGVGLTDATGLRVSAPGPSEPGDGTGETTGQGLTVRVTVRNAVEYGPDLEYGRPNLRAGLHLAGALREEGRVVARLVGDEFARAWEG